MLYIYIYILYGVCSCLHIDTTTDSAFCPGSKLAFILILEPELGFRDKSLETFVPGGKNRDKISMMLKFFCVPRDSITRPLGTKGSPFSSGWCYQLGQKSWAFCPPLARLAVGPGTKATFCLGPKDSRDKWPGTKVCSVVV